MPLYRVSAEGPFFYFPKQVYTLQDKSSSTNPSRVGPLHQELF